jgi:hypothetical protein
LGYPGDEHSGSKLFEMIIHTLKPRGDAQKRLRKENARKFLSTPVRANGWAIFKNNIVQTMGGAAMLSEDLTAGQVFRCIQTAFYASSEQWKALATMLSQKFNSDLLDSALDYHTIMQCDPNANSSAAMFRMVDAVVNTWKEYGVDGPSVAIKNIAGLAAEVPSVPNDDLAGGAFTRSGGGGAGRGRGAWNGVTHHGAKSGPTDSGSRNVVLEVPAICKYHGYFVKHTEAQCNRNPAVIQAKANIAAAREAGSAPATKENLSWPDKSRQDRHALMDCYSCGKKGHIQHHCPTGPRRDANTVGDGRPQLATADRDNGVGGLAIGMQNDG